eukprot:7350983-Prymnesium_polylepis.1
MSAAVDKADAREVHVAAQTQYSAVLPESHRAEAEVPTIHVNTAHHDACSVEHTNLCAHLEHVPVVHFGHTHVVEAEWCSEHHLRA